MLQWSSMDRMTGKLAGEKELPLLEPCLQEAPLKTWLLCPPRAVCTHTSPCCVCSCAASSLQCKRPPARCPHHGLWAGDQKAAEVSPQPSLPRDSFQGEICPWLEPQQHVLFPLSPGCLVPAPWYRWASPGCRWCLPTPRLPDSSAHGSLGPCGTHSEVTKACSLIVTNTSENLILVVKVCPW